MRSRASCGSSPAKDLDRAEAWPQQAGQNAQQRGFSGAVFADQHIAVAGLKIDRDLAQRGKGAEQLGNRLRAGHSCRSWSQSGFRVMQSVGGDRRGRSRRCGRGYGMREDLPAGWAAAGAMPGWPPGCAGAYLLAHLACRIIGVEDAVAADSAYRQCLRVILECVGRRLRALVDHLQHAALGRPWESGFQTRSEQR